MEGGPAYATAISDSLGLTGEGKLQHTWPIDAVLNRPRGSILLPSASVRRDDHAQRSGCTQHSCTAMLRVCQAQSIKLTSLAVFIHQVNLCYKHAAVQVKYVAGLQMQSNDRKSRCSASTEKSRYTPKPDSHHYNSIPIEENSRYICHFMLAAADTSVLRIPRCSHS